MKKNRIKRVKELIQEYKEEMSSSPVAPKVVEDWLAKNNATAVVLLFAEYIEHLKETRHAEPGCEFCLICDNEFAIESGHKCQFCHEFVCDDCFVEVVGGGECTDCLNNRV